MPVVFYDSNAILEETIDISTLTAPTEDDTGIRPTRNMWFDFSGLATEISGNTTNGKCFIKDVSVSIKKDRDVSGNLRKTYVQYQANSSAFTHCAVVSISFVPNITYDDVVDASFSVTRNTASTLYAKDGNVPIADNSYDVALGCYTWEQIYATPHAVLTTQNATNGANAATFGTLIYDSAGLDAHRKVAYTTIFKKIYKDLFGTHPKGEVPGLDNAPNVYYEEIDGREVHTYEMYVTLDSDGSSAEPVFNVDNLHQVKWHIDRGDENVTATEVKTDTVGMDDDALKKNTAARFWRDMIIEHADLSGNIDFNAKTGTLTGDDVFTFWQVNEKRLDDGTIKIKRRETSGDFKNHMQKSFASMLVNVINHYNANNTESDRRYWLYHSLNGGAYSESSKKSMFGAAGSTKALDSALGRKLTGNVFQTNHHHRHTGDINLVFERVETLSNEADFDGIDPLTIGELVEVNIPIKSSNYGNDGIDTGDGNVYELFLRANIDLTFDVDGSGNTAEQGTVFYGQSTGTLKELMFGIAVKPESTVNVVAMTSDSLRANAAYMGTFNNHETVVEFIREVTERNSVYDRFKLEINDDLGTSTFKDFGNLFITDLPNLPDNTVIFTDITPHKVTLSAYMDAAAAFSDATDAANDPTTSETNANNAVTEHQASDTELVLANTDMSTIRGVAINDVKAIIAQMRFVETAFVRTHSSEPDESLGAGAKLSDGTNDAFHYAISVLKTNINKCVVMDTEMSEWVTEMKLDTVNNHVVSIGKVEDHLLDIRTVKASYQTIHTQIDTIGGLGSELRASDNWGTISASKFKLDAEITYDNISEQLAIADRFIAARDTLWSINITDLKNQANAIIDAADITEGGIGGTAETKTAALTVTDFLDIDFG